VIDRALVFTGGEFDIEWLADKLATLSTNSGDYVLCIDSGLAACDALNLSVDCLLGDEDSVDPTLLARRENTIKSRLRYSPNKDASDLELGLLHLVEQQCAQAIVLGVSGGRTDHMLFNWLLGAQQWPFQLQFIDATTDAYLLQNSRLSIELENCTGATLSLLAMTQVQGVTTEGLRYALTDATLNPGSTYALSNQVLANRAGVRIDSGTLWVLLNRKIGAHGLVVDC